MLGDGPCGCRPAPRPVLTLMPRRTPSQTATLTRVRRILEETCAADGQGMNLQESARRKSYRVGINRALAAIDELDTAKTKQPE